MSLKDYSHLQHVQKDITRRLRREVWQTRLYTTADGREHSLAALGFICIVLIWGASVLRRVMQRGIRIAVLAECAFIIGWVLLRHFKYQITVSGTLSRYCWYGYYFFQTGLPLVLLWIAWMVGQGEVNAAPPRWLRACTWLDAALVALVFTNDLHNLVFRLDLSSSGWTDVYGYGSGYFLALGVMCACSDCTGNPLGKGLAQPAPLETGPPVAVVSADARVWPGIRGGYPCSAPERFYRYVLPAGYPVF